MWTVRFIDLAKHETILTAKEGQNLRLLLLEHQLGPYTQITRQLNCRGNGLCATCGVWVAESHDLEPTHWHDWAARRFGYPRLSCQVVIDRNLTVFQVDKWIWGNGRSKDRDMRSK